jgi:hypothetical protein
MIDSCGVKRIRTRAPRDVTSVVLAHGENPRASFGRPLRRLLSVGPGSLHQPISCPEARASSLSASTDARLARDSHRASGRPLGDERNGYYRLAADGGIRWPQRALEVASNRLKWKCVRLPAPRRGVEGGILGSWRDS